MKRKRMFSALVLAVALAGDAGANARKPSAPLTTLQQRNQRLMELINVNITITPQQREAIKTALENQDRAWEDLNRDFQKKQDDLQQNTDATVASVLTSDEKQSLARVREALRHEVERAERERNAPSGVAAGPSVDGEPREARGR